MNRHVAPDDPTSRGGNGLPVLQIRSPVLLHCCIRSATGRTDPSITWQISKNVGSTRLNFPRGPSSAIDSSARPAEQEAFMLWSVEFPPDRLIAISEFAAKPIARKCLTS